jgi:hypothetical protein
MAFLHNFKLATVRNRLPWNKAKGKAASCPPNLKGTSNGANQPTYRAQSYSAGEGVYADGGNLYLRVRGEGRKFSWTR